jgi:lipoic acid synthetase
VKTGNPRGAVDPREPEHVARAIASLDLRYVVLTMVDRDDLLDGGADHVGRTVTALKTHQPDLLVETLVGDFQGRATDLEVLLAAEPDVYAHNIEVVRRLTPKIRDQRCSYDRSLGVLADAKRIAPDRLTKSSIMVGIGETDDEVVQTMEDLRAAAVDVVTIGQYLRPTDKHAPVDRYVTPDVFKDYERAGMALDFSFVASGPLVRSSYHAAEGFIAAQLRSGVTSPARRTGGEPGSQPVVGSVLLPASSLVRKPEAEAGR